MLRPIIKIDEDKCDGCGQCVLDCQEGALKVINGKAKLISETFCDGLGACLHCPNGALTLEAREGAPFDEAAVLAAKAQSFPSASQVLAENSFAKKPLNLAKPLVSTTLTTWPIQLRLLTGKAPFLQGAKVLLAAHCTAFGLESFSSKYLQDQVLVISCPKLEPRVELFNHLLDIVKVAKLKEINILRMSVPCCQGLERLVVQVFNTLGFTLPMRVQVLEVPRAS